MLDPHVEIKVKKSGLLHLSVADTEAHLGEAIRALASRIARGECTVEGDMFAC